MAGMALMAGRQRPRPANVRPTRTPPLNISTGHVVTDRMLSSHAQAIETIQRSPAQQLRVIGNVVLADTANVYVPHGLGQQPIFVKASAPRGALGAGIVRDVTDGAVPGLFNTPVDRSRYVVLRADGYGATITVDILVM